MSLAKIDADAVAVFNTRTVQGIVLCIQDGKGVIIRAKFTHLPPGLHGFHIHSAGDLRGEGCAGACAHFHKGPPTTHGGPPGTTKKRHTGDLGNIFTTSEEFTYHLDSLKVSELYGRSFIVHANSDDYGMGDKPDSHVTGHSGKRIGCAVIGMAKKGSA
jgi:Cu-Zn family superoxide dismutase